MKKYSHRISIVVLGGTFAAAQQPGAAGAPAQPQRQRRAPDPRSMGGGDCRDNPYNCDDAPNPLPAANTRVARRDDLDGRARRAQGRQDQHHRLDRRHGAERSVAGHRQAQLRAACQLRSDRPQDGQRACARRSSSSCPRATSRPKTGHMTSPGTITMREETFRCVLTDTAESLQAHGFKNIIFIGDSGGNQKRPEGGGREADREVGRQGARAAHRASTTTTPASPKYMEGQGIDDGTSDNMHDDPIITLNMFIDDPNSVRFDERVKAGKATINGVIDRRRRRRTPHWRRRSSSSAPPRRSRRSTSTSPRRARRRRRSSNNWQLPTFNCQS